MEQDTKTIDFIERAQKLHNAMYDYSKVQYKNSSLKVTITCFKHGDFYQTPNNHLKPSGCKECRNMKLRQERQKTLTDFVKQSKEMHGNEYDYNKVQYINGNTKVIITCSAHGDFEQLPSGHLNGKGCALCYGTQKMTTKEFITRAQDLHQQKYDYSKVKYTNYHGKVVITCFIHGDFEQTPASHLKPCGCSKCGDMKTIQKLSLTNEQFIQKAREVHGNKYKYDKVVYINSNTKVIITCLIHGDFEQTPASHCNLKCGCPKCRDMKISEKLSLTNEEFIEKSKELHGDFYDYSKVEYVNCYKKVIIICEIHGEFEQAPTTHLKPAGCPKCAKNYLGELFKLTKEQFIEKSQLKHENRYDYSNVIYINGKTNVKIICAIHGEFEQTPISHMKGHGCVLCGQSKTGDQLRIYIIG